LIDNKKEAPLMVRPGKIVLFTIIPILLLLSADVIAFPFGPINISTAEIGLLCIFIMSPAMKKNIVGQLDRESAPLLIASILFIGCGVVSTIYSPIATWFPYKMLARYVVLIVGIWLLRFYFSSVVWKKTYLLYLFILAVWLSVITLPERYIPSFGQFLALVFRDGNSIYMNGILRPASTLSHANALASFNVVALWLGVFLMKEKFISTKLFWIGVVFLIAEICLSSSRNSFLAFIVGWVILIFKKENRILAYRLVGLFLVFYIALSPSLKRAGEYADESSLNRFHLWKSAITMWKDNPIIGVGPGCYNQLLPRYASETLLTNENSNIKKNALNAHNIFLNILSEFGGLGFVVFSIIGTLYFKSFIKIYPFRLHVERYSIVGAMIAPFLFDYGFSYFYILIIGSLLLLISTKDTGIKDHIIPGKL
jgi:O-antigen ligase